MGYGRTLMNITRDPKTFTYGYYCGVCNTEYRAVPPVMWSQNFAPAVAEMIRHYVLEHNFRERDFGRPADWRDSINSHTGVQSKSLWQILGLQMFGLEPIRRERFVKPMNITFDYLTRAYGHYCKMCERDFGPDMSEIHPAHNASFTAAFTSMMTHQVEQHEMSEDEFVDMASWVDTINAHDSRTINQLPPIRRRRRFRPYRALESLVRSGLAGLSVLMRIRGRVELTIWIKEISHAEDSS